MTRTQHRIEPQILTILANCAVVDNHLALPPGQLPRPTYDAVNKVLELMGGKWHRGKRVHVFAESPAELLDTLLLTGEITDRKKLFQFYETPLAIAQRMIDKAEIISGDRILEPSAGKGAILRPLQDFRSTCQIIAVELNETLTGLTSLCSRVYFGDFLQCSELPRMGGTDMRMLGTFDVILMNPPFSGLQDVKHIIHAMGFLKRGGRLVGICANGTRQREKLRRMVDEWEDLPAGTFSESGTEVATAMVTVRN